LIKKGIKLKKNKELTKSIIFMFVIIIVVIIIGIASYFILGSNDKTTTITDKSVDEISGYNISLSENDSDTYKNAYYELKENLTSDNIDYDAYALSVAKLFVIDLYTMDTKINKYDVGGLELVLPDYQDNYTLNVTNTIYNYLEDNTNGKRTQSNPHVKSVAVSSNEKKEYTIGDDTYNAYVFNIEITYSTDLGYDKNAEVIVINKDNHMYVVEKN
jgi:hypothetical protein